jgi:MFS family permease
LGTNPFLGSLSGAVVGLFGNILIMLFMDRIPRKPMLIGGFILSGILTAVAGATTNPYYVITMISIVSFTSSIP